MAGLSQEQMAKMEREMTNLQGKYKMVEQTYGQDVLNLVLAKRYLVIPPLLTAAKSRN